MRLGTAESDILQGINERNIQIRDEFLKRFVKLTRTVPVKVMMGDSTITEQQTFDPGLLTGFLQGMAGRLKEWSVQDISTSNNEDIRRIFLKFERMAGSYLISVHLSVQFHVLLYYVPDHRVIECQKELSELVDMTKNREEQISEYGDQFVLHKLKEMGYRDLDHQSLFEIFYKNDKLREEMYRDMEDGAGVDRDDEEKKKKLFDELDSLLLETYQVSQVMIDDARLVTGEEGCLCTIDLEFVKNNAKQGSFDPKKMPLHARKKIIECLDGILAAMKNGASGSN